MSEMQKQDFFVTQDLYLAAFLLVMNVPLDEVRRTYSGRAEFVFSAKLAGPYIDKYFRDATVEAKRYAASLRDIKTLMHAREVRRA
jgi:hypothetical protein